jgi:hypothetical protein
VRSTSAARRQRLALVIRHSRGVKLITNCFWEQRLRDSILQEMGLTEDDVKAMPPEKQLAIGKEIAERMQDKIKLAQTEKENSSSEKGSSQVVDKFLASL